MEPIFIKDLFTEKERSDILETLAKKEHYQLEGTGRVLSNLNSLSNEIKKKLLDLAELKLNKNLKLVGEGFTTYKKQYGEPWLDPHIDFNETSYILDYQFDSNIEWPIFVEGESFTLNNNEAVLFSGKNQIHWRPKRKFSDDEYVSMIFFHFIDLDDIDSSKSREYTEEEKIRLEKYFKIWNES